MCPCPPPQVFFAMLLRNVPERQALMASLSRVFAGLSDTAKAFIIIATTDILLGYHSEDGWTVALRMVGSHWGYEIEVRRKGCAIAGWKSTQVGVEK